MSTRSDTNINNSNTGLFSLGKIYERVESNLIAIMKVSMVFKNCHIKSLKIKEIMLGLNLFLRSLKIIQILAMVEHKIFI